MDLYFVYSSGGGAGDWNGINRVFSNSMPENFKKNLLIKFGDIFFNHRSNGSILRPRAWRDVDNARKWLIQKTGDDFLMNSPNLIMDVGTTKIVSFITHNHPDFTDIQIINEFDRIIEEESILEKYAEIINNSSISNAVTFDIPNLFKVRTQQGNVNRNLFSTNAAKQRMIDLAAKYANHTYRLTGEDPDKLLTIISAEWSNQDIDRYLELLDYVPTKLGIGALTNFPNAQFEDMLRRLDEHLVFDRYSKVHFLGSGGIEKSNMIIGTLGNQRNFSVDVTTPFNRGIDGNTSGTSQSGYYDYQNKRLHRITPENIEHIMSLHQNFNNERKYFTNEEMREILNSILQHQNRNSSLETYNNRAKLIIHNFDVYQFNIE
ncbi:hypothetical protein HX014_15675 [Myroides marinus]|uniref:hypothetical protein n=1 Tax=Myroides marinus TaxID=703342 RepID=UPI002578E8BB|nr:hypothetical protein [Myroides marinus]MDM1352077.1 hypothetical protein [Myroides marinus]MDM1359237.1 hypothetical protein [Myroides marinus]